MSDSTAFALIAGRYQLEQRIGAGGSGEVWRATDTLLNRPVAVKIMRSELAGQEVARRRFQAEARHAGSLVHVAIAKLYDYDEAGPEQRPFLVMEYVHGHSLAEELSGRAVSPARAMDLVAQIAAGLHAAHSAGLGHGDIKPHNVLLDFDGRVKLTDFGVTFGPADSETTGPEALLGTPEYRAPERMTGGPASAASDLYSLGILAYQCLTGRVPFRGRVAEVAEAHRGWPLPPLPPGVPAPIVELIDDLTAKDPADRPADADEVAHRAAALRDELALEAPAGITALPGGSTAGPGGAAAPVSPSAAGGGGQGPPWRRQRGRRYLALAAVAASAAAAWTAASVLISPGGQSGGNAPRTRLVDVNAAALRGKPVTVVTLRLRDEGLIVTVQWRPDSGLPTGLVISVRPAGWLSAGTRVLVTGSAAPGTTHRPGPAKSAVPPPGAPVRPAPPRPHPTKPGDPPILTSGPAPSIPLPSASSTSPTPSVSPTPTATPTPSPDPSGSTGTDRPPTISARAGHNSHSAPARRPYRNLCDLSGPDWVLISLAASLPPAAAGCPPFPPAAGQR